jgi:hypothetical protein
MADTKLTTPWAIVSLVCGALGCLGTAALPAIYSHGMSQETTGVSAGLAVACVGFLALVLCLLGVTGGAVALRKIRGGEGGGRGVAWTGIVLGCLPPAVLLALAAPAWLEELWSRIGGR